MSLHRRHPHLQWDLQVVVPRPGVVDRDQIRHDSIRVQVVLVVNVVIVVVAEEQVVLVGEYERKRLVVTESIGGCLP